MNAIFSVVVPVFNAELYIEECIQSVLHQTYKNYELILVDDGTLDNSGGICDKYAYNYTQIKAYHKENGGQLHTREYAINHATGKYIVFLDSDDLLKPNALQRIFETFNHYQCDCVIYGYEGYDGEKNTPGVHHIQEMVTGDKRLIYRKLFFEDGGNSVCLKAVKKSILGSVNYSAYYHIRFGEDLLQSMEIVRNSKTIAYIPDCIYLYRKNPNSMMREKTYEHYMVDYTVRKKTYDFLQEEKVFTESDYIEYNQKCLHVVLTHVVEVCALPTSIGNKKKLLAQIREDSFYQFTLSKGKRVFPAYHPRFWVNWLFQYRMDMVLIPICQIWKSVCKR